MWLNLKRFSILLPARNGLAYVKLCVASVLAQTLADEFELIVLENASDDGTLEWLNSLLDPRIRVLSHEPPLSIEENWARILTTPRGEFMTIIGYDDLFDADYLETMGALVDEHPGAGLYQAHFRLIDAAGAFVRRCRPMPARETAAEFMGARLGMVRDSFATGYLMRSKDYDRVGGIPLNFQKLIYADDALWIRLMENSWKATSPREVFSYRAHASTSVAIDPMILRDTLEHYVAFLRESSSRDPVMEDLLLRYAPAFLAAQSEEIHARLLRRSLQGVAPYPACARARVLRLVELLGASQIPRFRPTLEGRFVGLCDWLPGGGWLYRAGKALARTLKGGLARQQ